jgi:hypothetical protein
MSENSVVPSEPQGGSIAIPGVHGDTSLLADLRSRVVTSYDSQVPAQRDALSRHLETSDGTGRSWINEQLSVQHFIITDAKRRSKLTGELEACARLILVTDQDESWSTTSQWAIESFLRFAGLHGLPPWVPARRMEIVEVATSTGQTTYKLRPASVDPGGARKGGGK